MAIPLIPIYFVNKAHVHLPNEIWIAIIIYEGIIWSLGIYLEQMSVALLYLWHLKWVQNGSVGDLSSFIKPNLLKDFEEFGNSGNNSSSTS